MKPTNSVVLLALAALATTHAFIHLTPWDKEVVYDWKALVKAGTHLPANYASQFVLHGKIHLQSNNNSTHVKITDLTYQMYNGILDHVREHEAHKVPVPEDVAHLEQVFKIVYGSDGLATGIATENHEKEFSRNIKKAIGTIFQMHHSVLEEAHHHAHGFVTKEHSIYGRHDVDYMIFPRQEDVIEVHKLHEMRDSQHLYQHLTSNIEMRPCSGYENPIKHDSMKKYHIVKRDGHYFVKHIEASGVIAHFPFKGKAEAQHIKVNQTFEFEKVVPVEQQFHLQSGHFEDHLTYHSFDDTEDGSIRDVTNGRHVVNYEKLTVTVKHMLEDIHQYLQEDHIHAREPDSKRGQLINRVQRLLQKFSHEKLKDLHKSLTGVGLDVFHHVLPLVGTRASALLIKHLVVHKEINDDLAVDMLHQLPEHVVEPTVALLTELEDFIHLPDDVHWNVRKVAILTFANLVHQSSKTHHNDQHTYEKYVVEYLNRLKSSQEMKVQMTYLFALHNTGMKSVIKHLHPGITGELWHNKHLRFLSLMASGLPMLMDSNPHTKIENLWPIVTNRQESTDLRIMSYYYITLLQPSHSQLTNLAVFMLTEPDDELYHFHYTFLRSMMNSHDPCKQELRLMAAQLLKFTPPPSHGVSHVEIIDYEDEEFGLRGALEKYVHHTNRSRAWYFNLQFQETNIYHEDLGIYIKVHGIDQNELDPAIDIFKNKKLTKIGNSKDIHIEVIMFKHEYVINTFYFDEHNLHELNYLLDFFAQDSQSLVKDWLHVDYYRYHQALIPTDLGTPTYWEKLIPVVHQHKINIVKEVVNKVINVHVDNKHISWAHHRLGLVFYNPIADVWQGIARYHSFDARLPLRFDITLNQQQQILQVSWKKHEDPRKQIAGLRSHVKQMVFVKDDYDRNVLVQSSPHCKNFQVVSHGEQFINNYTFIHEDDLTTGHRWHIGAYGSSRHMSNGSFHHQMHIFKDSHTKQFSDPLGQLVAIFGHLHHYMTMLPKPGTYGCIVKVEPTHDHPVSNIDLSVRLNNEIFDDTYYYTPGRKWSARVTYAVKNREQSLKTWDVNAIIDMNPGRKVNNIKVHMTRIVPGQQDYKICMDGVKKWTHKGVTGHLNVAMSQTPDGKCVKDDTVIDVTMTGEHSHEQLDGRHKYGACQYVIPYGTPHYHTMQCLVAHSTVRHYVYNVKTTNVPTEFKKIFAEWSDYVKGHYMSYYEYEDEHDDDVDEHHLKVDVVYPMEDREVDVHVTTHQHKYKLTGVPIDYWKWYGIFPDSTAYSFWFQYFHGTDNVDHCAVHHDHHVLNHRYHGEAVAGDWTLYVGNVARNPQKAVYVKHVADDKIAVRAVDGGHTIEIIPHGDTHQISLDGQVISDEEHHQDDWIYYHVFTQDVHHPVAVMLPHSGIHFEYDIHHVVIVVPRVDQQLHGHCYVHHL